MILNSIQNTCGKGNYIIIDIFIVLMCRPDSSNGQCSHEQPRITDWTFIRNITVRSEYPDYPTAPLRFYFTTMQYDTWRIISKQKIKVNIHI